MTSNILFGLTVGLLSGLYMGFAVGVTHEPVQIVHAKTCPTAQQVLADQYRPLFSELK